MRHYLNIFALWVVAALTAASISAAGTNDPEVERRNEKIFLEWSPRMHDELLRRTRAAAPDSE